MSLFTDRVAEFSPCRAYRYWLEIVWDRDAGRLGWLMLNPSTADEINDDPTIRKCKAFARLHGYGGVIIGNLYALRSTDPHGLWEADDPCGIDNETWLEQLRYRTNRIIAGWGKNARSQEARRVLEIIPDLDCLGVNKDGSPMHPLYIPYSQPIMPYARGGVRVAEERGLREARQIPRSEAQR